MEVLETSTSIQLKHINKSLNVIKCLAAFAVICIHCDLYKLGFIGAEITALSRFAVPIFFLISGFYSYFNDKDIAIKKYRNRIIKLIKLLFMSNLLYLLISMYNHSFSIQEIYSNILNLNSWINYIVFNQTPSIMGMHLWFLQALICCYIFFVILRKFPINISKLYKIIPFLLIINVFFEKFVLFFGFNINCIYYRNFLFTGLPFFILGYYIHDKQKNLMKLSQISLIVCIFMSFILVVFEFFITRIMANLYIGTILLSTSIFLWCVLNPKSLDFKIIGYIGGNLYTYIYVLHLMFVGMVLFRFNLGYFNPITVFIITTFVSIIVYIFNKKLKIL